MIYGLVFTLKGKVYVVLLFNISQTIQQQFANNCLAYYGQWLKETIRKEKLLAEKAKDEIYELCDKAEGILDVISVK